MKTKAANNRDTYMDLIQQVPLRPIRTKADYRRAASMMDRLTSRDEGSLDAGESDYLDVLSDLIEAYEDAQSAIGRDDIPPGERFAALMRNAGLSIGQMADLLGVTRPLVSMVLSGKRSLSRASIQKLVRHFQIEPGYFM